MWQRLHKTLTRWARVIATCSLLVLPAPVESGSEAHLTYLGHASFEFVTPAGARIIIDPYGNSLWSHWFDRPFPSRPADFVLVTHPHFDHDAWTRVQGDFLLIKSPGTRTLGDTTVIAISGRHARAERYGAANLVFHLTINGIRIVHWGDNDTRLTPALSEQLRHVDILMLPVDESEHLLTLDEVAFLTRQLAPKILIPTHYFDPRLTSRCSTLQPIDHWLTTQLRVRRIPANGVPLSPETLPSAPEVWVFDPILAPTTTASRLSALPCPLQTTAYQLGLLGYLGLGLLLGSAVFFTRTRTMASGLATRSLACLTLIVSVWPIVLVAGLRRRRRSAPRDITLALKRIFIAVVVSAIAIASLGVFLFPLHADFLVHVVHAHPMLAPLTFITLRFLAAVIAPIPQLPISLAAIPLFGWWQAMLYAMVGSTVGAMTSFLLARAFREPLVARLAPLQKIKTWEARLTERQEFLTFVLIRFLTELMTDVVSYAAGLTRMRLWHYTAATIIGDLPWKLLVFYVGGKSAQYGKLGIIAFLVLLLVGFVVFGRSRLYRNLDGP